MNKAARPIPGQRAKTFNAKAAATYMAGTTAQSKAPSSTAAATEEQASKKPDNKRATGGGNKKVTESMLMSDQGIPELERIIRSKICGDRKYGVKSRLLTLLDDVYVKWARRMHSTIGFEEFIVQLHQVGGKKNMRAFLDARRNIGHRRSKTAAKTVVATLTKDVNKAPKTATTAVQVPVSSDIQAVNQEPNVNHDDGDDVFDTYHGNGDSDLDMDDPHNGHRDMVQISAETEPRSKPAADNNEQGSDAASQAKESPTDQNTDREAEEMRYDDLEPMHEESLVDNREDYDDYDEDVVRELY